MELTKEQVQEWCGFNGYKLIEDKNNDSECLPKNQILNERTKGILIRVGIALNISPSEICKKTRKRKIVEIRQLCHAIAKRHLSLSMAKIGYDIGGKDHATVLHFARTVNNLLDTDKTYVEQYEEIIRLCGLKKLNKQ